MQQEGEFIASGQPMTASVQPMVPVAEKPQKAKSCRMTKILCVIFALIAAGLGGYICYDKAIARNDAVGDGKMSSEEQIDEIEEKRAGEVISARVADEAEVKKLIFDLKVALQEHLDAADEKLHYDHVPKVYYNEYGVGAIIDDGLATAIPEVYSLVLPNGVLDDNMKDKVLAGALDIDGLFAKELSSRGFTEEKSLNSDLWGSVSYRNDNGIYCEFLDHEELPYAISCGAESSISEEQKSFVLELAGAYEEKTGNKVGWLMADKSDTEDSKTAGYQVLSASHGEGLGVVLSYKSGW